jgi:hypothetical protein
MKKEEFPTFLNEQPTVVFGRTTRELLVILVGLTGAYLVWTNLGSFLPGSDIGVLLIKGLFSTVPLVGSLIVAFVKIASRPLEEWAAIGVFYFLTPKVYLYMPLEEAGESENSINTSQYQHAKPGQGDDDEY